MDVVVNRENTLPCEYKAVQEQFNIKVAIRIFKKILRDRLRRPKRVKE
jgi:hypothetical protein